MNGILTLAYGGSSYIIFLLTFYILLAIQLEERDLMRAHPEYADYRRQVPMLVPAWPQHVTAAEPGHSARA